MATTTRRTIDRIIDLDVNGSRQRIRLRGEHDGRPPLLVVQGGPGLPLLNEIRKFQRLLDLERDFLVAYWEQRGCGDAPPGAAEGVSMHQQVADLRTVLRWLFDETKQRVTVLAISMGGTLALLAAEQAHQHVKAIVAVSADSQTASADAAADAFIRTQGARSASRGTRKRAIALPKPPYLDQAAFQQRVRLFCDLGAIENGRSFAALATETFLSLLRTYGVRGAIRALRNMTRIQSKLMPEVNELDLFAHPPRLDMPVHFVFGERDALNPPALVSRVRATIAPPGSTLTVVPNAGHHVHFDHPGVVRAILVQA